MAFNSSFAGSSGVENFINNSIDFGTLYNAAATQDALERLNAVKREGSTFNDVLGDEAGSIIKNYTMEGQQNLHNAQMFSKNLGTFAGLLSDGIGAAGDAGWFKGGGSGGGDVETDLSVYVSDKRAKNTIENIDDGLTLLKSLRPVTFYYNEDYSTNPERMHYGFIAQEYQQVMPDQTYYNESIDKLCIDTNELIAVLVRAIQQLESRIKSLELSFEAQYPMSLDFANRLNKHNFSLAGIGKNNG